MHAGSKEEAEFRATQLGQKFYKFEHALARAWRMDTEEGIDPRRSDKSLREIWAKADAARLEFLAELKRLHEWHDASEHPRGLWVIGEYRHPIQGFLLERPFYCDQMGHWYGAESDTADPRGGPLLMSGDRPLRWYVIKDWRERLKEEFLNG